MRHFIGKLTFVLGCAVCTALPARAQTTNHNFEVMKHLDIFNQLYRELDLFYVDTLSAKKNIGNAINYMLEMIDPYTEYYAAENTNDLKQMTTGKYAGIGSVISYRDELKRCIIEKPYEGNPAADAGLLPGDIILAIDGKDIEFRIYYISPLGSFATWKSTKQTGSYDMQTFEIHARPTQQVEGLRPGMSVLLKMKNKK